MAFNDMKKPKASYVAPFVANEKEEPKAKVVEPEKPRVSAADEADKKRKKKLEAREKLAVELRESGLTVDQKRARVREFLAGG